MLLIADLLFHGADQQFKVFQKCLKVFLVFNLLLQKVVKQILAVYFAGCESQIPVRAAWSKILCPSTL